MNNNDFAKLLNENAQKVEKALDDYLSNKDDNGLAQSMRYSLLYGGKRIRPFIVMEAYKLFSGDASVEKAIPFACALEMIHTYSLIHDDLPCMDNDDLRRGKPTNHKVFGEGVALLAGDTLLTYAFEVLASNNLVSDKSIRLATLALSKCAGFSGMAGGQMIDLSSMNNIKSFDELKVMHSLKTGALIRCAMLLGYYAACDNPSKDIIDDIESYATNLGIAFQIRDDILDRIADCETLGKPVGSDDKNGKTTSLTFMSVDEAQGLVDSMTKDAIASIEKYYDDKDNRSLIDLANYMVGRNK
ncbi:MAG: polyprenyl synthetase family protein [Clostridia bacterium]|nr:polyprenyl synthetase family protein [Clostridia bacterium]